MRDVLAGLGQGGLTGWRNNQMRKEAIIARLQEGYTTIQRFSRWTTEIETMDAFFLMSSMVGAVGPVSWKTLRTLAGMVFKPCEMTARAGR